MLPLSFQKKKRLKIVKISVVYLALNDASTQYMCSVWSKTAPIHVIEVFYFPINS